MTQLHTWVQTGITIADNVQHVCRECHGTTWGDVEALDYAGCTPKSIEEHWREMGLTQSCETVGCEGWVATLHRFCGTCTKDHTRAMSEED
jgi:hypothetical protein